MICTRHSLTILLSIFLLLFSCSKETVTGDETVSRPEGWNDATHSNSVDPDYRTVFSGKVVHRIDITISSENWQAMEDSLTAIFGNLPDQRTATQVVPSAGKPLWVPVDVRFNDVVWTKVGFRFKGHSSLNAAVSAGSMKRPFKLDFDQFETEYPAIENQRFHGFKKVGFGNNAYDPTCLRDKIASDLFRAEGVPAPAKAYYTVYINHGEGPTYFGLYTASEIPGSEFLENQFGNSDGGLYKPENSDATKWLKDAVLNDQTAELCSGPGWTDYENALKKLHADRTDLDSWRSELNKNLNSRGFLKWLAVNSTIQNWDSYGKAPHNVFVYSSKGIMNWIAWDFDQSLQVVAGNDGEKGEHPTLRQGDKGGDSNRTPIPLDMSTVDDQWPLIRYLVDDSVSLGYYKEYLTTFSEGNFSVASFEERVTREKELLASYVTDELEGCTFSSADKFEKSAADLLAHVTKRHEELDEFLNQ